MKTVNHRTQLKPPTYYIACTLFRRLMGVVYLIAFVSLWTQVEGLLGQHGILPTEDYLARAQQHYLQQVPPESPVWSIPTLAWISAHDGFLQLLCLSGALFSVLLILDILPMLSLTLLWLFYLSLFHVGQAFLSFQWDILLLETGFLAIFVAPLVIRTVSAHDRDTS